MQAEIPRRKRLVAGAGRQGKALAAAGLRAGSGESGFVLVYVILILLLVVILGIMSVNTATTELQIASNHKVRMESFHRADGGVSVASELGEASLSCPGGFSSTIPGVLTATNIYVVTPDLGMNEILADDDSLLLDPDTAATGPGLGADYDACYPAPCSTSADPGNTYLRMGGEMTQNVGGALQQLAGYEGKGKGMASGGGARNYDMYARHYGRDNSQSVVRVQWRHVIGQEGTCIY